MKLRWPLTLMIRCHLAAGGRHHSQRAALRLVSRVERYEQVLVGSTRLWVVESALPPSWGKETSSAEDILAGAGVRLPMQVE
jgi:hypothetical protein